MVDDARIRGLNEAPIRAAGTYVLYEMTGARRLRANFALDQAIERSRSLRKPLLVVETLGASYAWANARKHAFAIAGMADNHAAASQAGLRYYAYVEPRSGAGRGLSEALAAQAAVVVTDDYPGQSMACGHAGEHPARIGCRVEAVDSNGIVPVRATSRTFKTAASFRRHLETGLENALAAGPVGRSISQRSLRGAARIPRDILQRWPETTRLSLEKVERLMPASPFDRSVGPVDLRGGSSAAGAALDVFVDTRLDDYGIGRNHPDRDVSSGLSPYLRFGHISAHETHGPCSPSSVGRWSEPGPSSTS